MSDANRGAFPWNQQQNHDGTWDQGGDPGMSLREHYAGQAMAAHITAIVYNVDWVENALANNKVRKEIFGRMAKASTESADALIAALAEEGGE